MIAPVSCTPEERDQLYRIAAQRGLTFSGMVKFDYLKTKTVSKVDTPELQALKNVLVELNNLQCKIEDIRGGTDNKALIEVIANTGFYLQSMGLNLTEIGFALKKKK